MDLGGLESREQPRPPWDWWCSQKQDVGAASSAGPGEGTGTGPTSAEEPGRSPEALSCLGCHLLCREKPPIQVFPGATEGT